MTSPGIGAEAGASLNTLADFYQGFFMAPHIVAQSLKGAIFTSAMLEEIGMTTSPHYTDVRTDLIQSVSFQKNALHQRVSLRVKLQNIDSQVGSAG